MQFEFSAGGLIVKKQNNNWMLLILKDKNGNWTFPKGLIDKSEKSEQAAVREIKEETGITKIKLMSKLPAIQYWYKREGQLIKKGVTYFVFEEVADEILKPQTEEGITEITWISLGDASNIIGYKDTNQKLIEETKKILNKLNI